jgi:hypothetical protein
VMLHFILNLGATLLPLGIIDQTTTFLLLVITVLSYWGIFEGLRRFMVNRTIIETGSIIPDLPVQQEDASQEENSPDGVS